VIRSIIAPYAMNRHEFRQVRCGVENQGWHDTLCWRLARIMGYDWLELLGVTKS